MEAVVQTHRITPSGHCQHLQTVVLSSATMAPLTLPPLPHTYPLPHATTMDDYHDYEHYDDHGGYGGDEGEKPSPIHPLTLYEFQSYVWLPLNGD